MTLFPHNCEKHGHRFEGRYDKSPASDKGLDYEGSQDFLLEYIKANTKKIYVKDICTRCGKEIVR